MVFEPFQDERDYFPSRSKQAMINLRVRDLEGPARAAARRRNRGGHQARMSDATDAGSFARIHDPEGNPIELWEPTAKA